MCFALYPVFVRLAELFPPCAVEARSAIGDRPRVWPNAAPVFNGLELTIGVSGKEVLYNWQILAISSEDYRHKENCVVLFNWNE